MAGSCGGGSYPSPVTITLSSTSTDQSLNSCLNGSYNDYQLRYHLVAAGTTPTAVITLNSSTSNYVGARYELQTTGSSTNVGQPGLSPSGITFSGGSSAVFSSGDVIDGSIILYDLNDASYHKMWTGSASFETGGQGYFITLGGQYQSNTAVSAMAIHITSGNFSGYVTCQVWPN